MAQIKETVAYIDGASRGNPGAAASAVIFFDSTGSRIDSLAKFLGSATNNVAEYQALLAALAYALEHNYSRLKIITDSELLARQIARRYKVKNPDLKILHERASRLIEQLESFSIQHVRREHNSEADRLANETLDAAEGKRPMRRPSGTATPKVLQVSATYRQGRLEPHSTVPLAEGEEVHLKIRREK